MKEGIIGRKLGMTQIITDDGELVPVTVVEAGPCAVVQKKNVENDGYSAVQLGFLEKRSNLVGKPEKGHFNKTKVAPQRYLRELRVEDVDGFEIGQNITVDIFSDGDVVDVTGTSKGKGMAGVMKRWGFGGARASHGAEKIHRKPGSIGCSATPSRVFKGKKMAGRMGGERVTVQNLSIAKVRAEENILLIKGAVPGHNKGLLVIKKAVKKG
ncbi:MAG: 50S ribosomal protein L3 [Deltaproteobacteria bacterium]|nr:50S ribosomal protein L3 [Deltaproteobacteria bacterium]